MMLKPTPLTIQQGRSFEQIVRWETEPFLFVPITSISNTAPLRIVTATAHGIPNGWRVAVVSSGGLTELNAGTNPPQDRDFRRLTVVDETTLELNPLSGANFGKHKAGTGYLQWYTPKSLAGYKGRMNVRTKYGGPILLNLTSENGGLTLDDTKKSIKISIPWTVTETIQWTRPMVYDLELESPESIVTAILAGPISLATEITTTI